MYIRQLGTFFFSFRIYISNNNVGYSKAEGEEQEDGRSLYSVELFAHFDTDCSTPPDYICSCINDDDGGEDIEDVNDKVDEMYCYKMTLKINTNDDEDKDKEDKKEEKKDQERRESLLLLLLSLSLLREKAIGEGEGEGEIGGCGGGEKVRIGGMGEVVDDG